MKNQTAAWTAAARWLSLSPAGCVGTVGKYSLRMRATNPTFGTFDSSQVPCS